MHYSASRGKNQRRANCKMWQDWYSDCSGAPTSIIHPLLYCTVYSDAVFPFGRSRNGVGQLVGREVINVPDHVVLLRAIFLRHTREIVVANSIPKTTYFVQSGTLDLTTRWSEREERERERERVYLAITTTEVNVLLNKLAETGYKSVARNHEIKANKGEGN